MRVREATSTDAPDIGDLIGVGDRVARRLVLDRAVYVAVEETGRDDASARRESDATDETRDATGGDGGNDTDEGRDDANDERDELPGDRSGDVVGVLAYEATDDAVHVTRLGGGPAALSRLFEEPIRFAATEDLPVEAVVPEDETTTIEALADAGFEDVGAGPAFESESTRRYRWEG